MNERKGYDRIVFVYDFIAGFFSFNQINKSQLGFLLHLSDQSSCLILGGGTGYFLQKLLEMNKTIHVTYIDASANMIAAAQQRIQKKIPDALDRVAFFCKEVENFEWQKYDVIVSNYFLDLFGEDHVQVLVKKFNKYLNPQGFVYITDFHIPETNSFVKWGTILGLKILYRVHKSITKMEVRKLPKIEKIMMMQNFSILYSENYLKGILKCNLYKKNH